MLHYVLHEGGWRLAFRPATVLNYWRARRETAAQAVTVSYQPTHLEVELSNKCNLSCVQCLRANTDIGTEGGMTLETFQKVIAEFPHVVAVALNGFGEVFLNRQWLEIIRWLNAERPWVRVVITTNGSFLNEKIVDELLSVRIARFDVSLDAASSGSYLAVRRAPFFDKIIAGVRRYVTERNRRGLRTPVLGLAFVILDANVHELSAMVQLAHDLGVDRITTMRGEFAPWGYANRNPRPAAEVAQLMRDAQALADRLGVEILENILIHADEVEGYAPGLKRATGHCEAFWNSIRIDFQGKVMLCCNSPLEAEWSYGSVIETPFARIWNGEKFRAARETSRAGGYVTRLCEPCRPVLPVIPSKPS